MHDPQTYLREEKDDGEIKIVILETDDDEYRLTENHGDGWSKPFWMPVAELRAHDPTRVGNLSSDQFLKVCRACGVTQ